MRRSVAVTLVLLALLALAACGSGSSPAPSGAAAPPEASEPAGAGGSPAAAACAESTDAAVVEVAIANSAFEPASATAAVGEVVAWTNQDSIPHSAVFEGCATATLQNGDTGSLVFNTAGAYDYVCGIHPNMTGTLAVE